SAPGSPGGPAWTPAPRRPPRLFPMAARAGPARFGCEGNRLSPPRGRRSQELRHPAARSGAARHRRAFGSRLLALLGAQPPFRRLTLGCTCRCPRVTQRMKASRQKSSCQNKAPTRHVVVIGGGIMGTSSAWELARRGQRVTLLEKVILGAEAPSAAAGILGPEIENEAPGPMLDLCRLSRKLYPEWIRELERSSQVSCGFLEGGSLLIPEDKRALRELTRRRRFQLDAAQAIP